MKPSILSAILVLCLIICCNNSLESNPPPAPDPSLVLNLSIYDTVKNTSMYQYVMSFTNPKYSTDRKGTANGALFFNGSNYLIIQPDSNLDFNSKSFTISLWVKADSNQMNGAGILTKGLAEHEQFSIDLDYNRYRFWVRDINSNLFIINTGKTVDNNWHRITAIYNQTQDSIFLFQDSTCIGKHNAPHKLLTTQEPLSIGARKGASGAYTYYLKGAISEIKIFNKVSLDEF